jgi:hypothetical protein
VTSGHMSPGGRLELVLRRGHTVAVTVRQVFCPFLAIGTLLVPSPLIVDAATGAWYEFSPNEIVVTFD